MLVRRHFHDGTLLAFFALFFQVCVAEDRESVQQTGHRVVLLSVAGCCNRQHAHTHTRINESIHPSPADSSRPKDSTGVRISRTHAASCSAKSSRHAHTGWAHTAVSSAHRREHIEERRNSIISYMQSNLKRYSEDSGQGHTQHNTLAGTSIN